MRPEISLIVPVLNERDAIPIFYKAVQDNLIACTDGIEMVFVDDGSTDESYQILVDIAKSDKNVRVIRLTRNFGKEAALMAGLESALGKCVVPIDVDLQDPIEVIPKLLAEWRSGAEIVLAVRQDRSSDSVAKRGTAKAFYRLHNKISTPKIMENVGDFRLLDRGVVDNIRALRERNLFMKGILGWVGGQTAIVPYTRAARSAGTSKFNGWKLWNFALEGITSFSTFPLRVWTYIGFVIALASIIHATIMVVETTIWGNPVPGYPSIITAILFLGGIQLIGIGVLGEYIGRIYIETKGRPRYIVRDEIKFNDDQ